MRGLQVRSIIPNYEPPETITPVVPGGSPYTIHLREFEAQILPSSGVPGGDIDVFDENGDFIRQDHYDPLEPTRRRGSGAI